MKKKTFGMTFAMFVLLLMSSSAYAAHYLLGVSAVDNKEIRWGGSTSYSSSWNYAISTWNALGKVNIAPDTVYTYQDLTITDKYKPNEPYDATYIYYSTLSDDLIINTAKFPNLTTSQRKNATTHELGHALGLNHSPYGNMMYMYNTGKTSLSTQDKNDYYYLWGN